MHWGTKNVKEVTCAKCELPISIGMGRKFRRKWRHEHCLPETRLKTIEMRREK